MNYTTELIPRILRDVDDGVISLDRHGSIININPQCRKLLGLDNDVVGQKYAEVFFENSKKENDGFHQFVVEAVRDKENKHIGTVVFTDKDSNRKHLRITSSFLKNDADGDSRGVVLVLSDVTEAETLRKKRYNASVVFSCVTACVCLYLLLLATLEFLSLNVPTKALTQVINGMVFVIGVIIFKKTEFSFEDLGLKIRNWKKTMGMSLIVAMLIVLLLMAAKLVVLRISPSFFAENTPFWNWNIGLYSWISYIFTCVIQEFLARSMIYGSIKRMFDGKHSTLWAILLSSLLFGAVHIAHGFMYMSAAIILLGSLGGLYEKHGNIWGVTLIHFVLGQAACCLGFLS